MPAKWQRGAPSSGCANREESLACYPQPALVSRRPGHG
eukprot:XP_001705845.1 Hypothetical protein GL50803_31520 [Giardia lamblia ATCC 50803]